MVKADVPDFATDLCAKPAKETEACQAKNKEVHRAKEEEVRRVSPREGNYNSSKKVPPCSDENGSKANLSGSRGSGMTQGRERSLILRSRLREE